MAITLRYNPAYENVLGVANDTGQGNLRRQLEEIARRDALDQQRLDESARQFDQGLQAQQYNQVANRGLQWANVAQNQAQLEQQAYNQQATLEARMAEQQMQNDAYAYGQDAQTQRAYGAEQARMARDLFRRGRGGKSGFAGPVPNIARAGAGSGGQRCARQDGSVHGGGAPAGGAHGADTTDADIARVHADLLCSTRVALVPPKPKEFVSA